MAPSRIHELRQLSTDGDVLIEQLWCTNKFVQYKQESPKSEAVSTQTPDKFTCHSNLAYKTQ